MLLHLHAGSPSLSAPSPPPHPSPVLLLSCPPPPSPVPLSAGWGLCSWPQSCRPLTECSVRGQGPPQPPSRSPWFCLQRGASPHTSLKATPPLPSHLGSDLALETKAWAPAAPGQLLPAGLPSPARIPGHGNLRPVPTAGPSQRGSRGLRGAAGDSFPLHSPSPSPPPKCRHSREIS